MGTMEFHLMLGTMGLISVGRSNERAAIVVLVTVLPKHQNGADFTIRLRL